MPRPGFRYRMIADHLAEEIRAGTLPLGSSLPTESELTRRFRVSRHTARNAVQLLREQGMVHSRRGKGTFVVGDGREAGFREEVQSIGELIALGQSTRRRLLSQRRVIADPELAGVFPCDEGRQYAQADLLRQTFDDPPRPLACLRLWMDVLYEPVIPMLTRVHKAAAEILAEEFGRETGSVRQTVEAKSLTPWMAKLLDAEAGLPALSILREYREAPDASPHLVALSVYPGRNLKIVSRFRGARKPGK